MRPFLLFFPYLAVPFLISLFFRVLRIKRVDLTCACTAVFFICYPLITLKIDEYLNPPLRPPPPGPRCGLVPMSWVIGSWLFFLPVAMGVQKIWNLLLVRRGAGSGVGGRGGAKTTRSEAARSAPGLMCAIAMSILAGVGETLAASGHPIAAYSPGPTSAKEEFRQLKRTTPKAPIPTAQVKPLRLGTVSSSFDEIVLNEKDHIVFWVDNSFSVHAADYTTGRQVWRFDGVKKTSTRPEWNVWIVGRYGNRLLVQKYVYASDLGERVAHVELLMLDDETGSALVPLPLEGDKLVGPVEHEGRIFLANVLTKTRNQADQSEVVSVVRAIGVRSGKVEKDARIAGLVTRLAVCDGKLVLEKRPGYECGYDCKQEVYSVEPTSMALAPASKECPELPGSRQSVTDGKTTWKIENKSLVSMDSRGKVRWRKVLQNARYNGPYLGQNTILVLTDDQPETDLLIEFDAATGRLLENVGTGTQVQEVYRAGESFLITTQLHELLSIDPTERTAYLQLTTAERVSRALQSMKDYNSLYEPAERSSFHMELERLVRRLAAIGDAAKPELKKHLAHNDDMIFAGAALGFSLMADDGDLPELAGVLERISQKDPKRFPHQAIEKELLAAISKDSPDHRSLRTKNCSIPGRRTRTARTGPCGWPLSTEGSELHATFGLLR